jgi:predicted transcriptional regulator
MNMTPDTSKTVPLPDLEPLLNAISHPKRWKMLRELSLGEPREISEMAEVGGCSYDMARKHLAVLMHAGIVVQGRGRLFQIQKHHLPAPGERVVDFGHCLLRLDALG